MARINFSFQGWINGANVYKVTDNSTGKKIDVSKKSAGTVVKMLNGGKYSLSLRDHLHETDREEVEIFDYEEQMI